MNKILFSIAVTAVVSTMPFAFADVSPLYQWGTGPFPVIDQYEQNSDGTWNFTFVIPDGKKAYGNINDGTQNYYGEHIVRLTSAEGTESFSLSSDFPKENWKGEQCVILQIYYEGAFGYSMQYICP